jgi:hypothetical protein
MHRTLPLLSLCACKVIDAPDELEALVVFGFVHFDDDIEYLRTTDAGMQPQVEAQLEILSEGLRVDSLTRDDLLQAGIDAPESGDIVGAMGVAEYRHGLDEVLVGVTWPDKLEDFDYLAYEVLEDSGRDCFLARECERWDSRVYERTEVPLLGEASLTHQDSYRWVEGDDGGISVAKISHNPDGIDFTSNLIEVHQQYQLVLFQPTSETSVRRVETFWVEMEAIGLDVPDYFAVETAVKEMRSQAEALDAFIDTTSSR